MLSCKRGKMTRPNCVSKQVLFNSTVWSQRWPQITDNLFHAYCFNHQPEDMHQDVLLLSHRLNFHRVSGMKMSFEFVDILNETRLFL